MMRKWFIAAVFLILELPTLAQNEGQQLGDGRIHLSATNFSITPPEGWEVSYNTSGVSLLLKGPKEQGEVSFQPTIEIRTFNGARFIDDITQTEYGKIIEEKFASASNQVFNYRLRDQRKIKFEDGRDALLYYTEYLINNVPLMQMHILISSADRHFLMTYTDIAKVFESDSSLGLSTAYRAMLTAQLDSTPPSRYRSLQMGIAILGSILILGFLIQIVRHLRAKRLNSYLDNDDSALVDSDGFKSGLSGVAPSAVIPLSYDHESTALAREEFSNSGFEPGREGLHSQPNRISSPRTLETKEDTMKARHRDAIPSSYGVPEASLPDVHTALKTDVPHLTANTSGLARLSEVLPPSAVSRASPKRRWFGLFRQKSQRNDRPSTETESDAWHTGVSELTERSGHTPKPPRTEARSTQFKPETSSSAPSDRLGTPERNSGKDHAKSAIESEWNLKRSPASSDDDNEED